MIIAENPKRIAAQICPLCNSPQDVIINGWEALGTPNPKEVTINNDKGYSFCNCRNILFTDWSNMKQGIYNPDYCKKYDNDHCNRLYVQTISKFLPKILNNVFTKNIIPSVLEIGSINPSTLDQFKKFNCETTGLDICEHPLGDHKLIVGDFENLISRETFDIIWASHIFEHFKDPIKAVRTSNSLLNEGGLLCVSMPDPWFIDFGNPYQWGHWHLNEHHILWDMDSFAEVLRENGFQIIDKKRNVDSDQICNCDFTVIAKKVIDVSNYS